VKFCLQGLLGGLPEWILEIEGRQQYITRKHLEAADDGDDFSVEKTESTVLPDEVDVDGMSLYDFRGTKVTKADLRKSEDLEKKRRRLQADLLHANAKLDEVMHQERLNVDTQMSESLEGHPLGLLRIVVQKIICEGESKWTNIVDKMRLEVSIRGDEVGRELREEVETESLEIPYPSRVSEKGFEVVLESSIGPIAPIASKTASVVFKVTAENDQSESSFLHLIEAVEQLPPQSASLSLTELVDQRPRELTLQLYHNLKGTNEGYRAEQEKGFILELELTFLYSKIIRRRQKLKRIKTELAEVEQTLSNVKLGKDDNDSTKNL